MCDPEQELSNANEERKKQTKNAGEFVESAGKEAVRITEDTLRITTGYDSGKAAAENPREFATTAALAMVPVVGPTLAATYAGGEYAAYQTEKAMADAAGGEVTTPEPVDPGQTVTIADADIQASLEIGRRRRSQASGRQSTIRTTPLGVTNREEVKQKSLLGV